MHGTVLSLPQRFFCLASSIRYSPFESIFLAHKNWCEVFAFEVIFPAWLKVGRISLKNVLWLCLEISQAYAPDSLQLFMHTTYNVAMHVSVAEQSFILNLFAWQKSLKEMGKTGRIFKKLASAAVAIFDVGQGTLSCASAPTDFRPYVLSIRSYIRSE